MSASAWAEMALRARAVSPPVGEDDPKWESCTSLADAVESKLDASAEDELTIAREEQREADERAFERAFEPLEKAARELLADYEHTLDLVGVSSTPFSARMREVLLDLDRRRTRG